jgi:hypothetical protein
MEHTDAHSANFDYQCGNFVTTHQDVCSFLNYDFDGLKYNVCALLQPFSNL